MLAFELPDALDAAAVQLLERHLDRAKEWFPHELVPWSRGRDFGGEEGESPPGRCLAPGVRSALIVNLLTEDNLPHYYHAIASAFGFDSAMGEWSRRWAAEEQRHAIVIRDWVTVGRELDLIELERARMCQVTTGFRPGGRGQTLSDGLVYLTLQELATRISHRNTGQLLEDPAGTAIMSRVATDENLHFLFYRDLASAALEINPSDVVIAIDRQVTDFEMPGTGIPGFAAHAAAIAGAGIYNYQVHYEQILAPVVLRHWGLESVEGLTPEAEAARAHALARIARVERVANRMAAAAAEGAASGRAPAAAP
jgi:acyl-[acyl-carrier-protein] desaturase